MTAEIPGEVPRVVDRQRGVVPSLRRIRALIRRHAYLLLKSWPRIVSMAYYPTVTMVLWAFVTLYLAPTNRFLADAPGFFIGAVLLWDVLFRGQLGVSLTFTEEMYSRNLGNLFVSPLRLYELIAEGRFPKPYKLSDRASAWDSGEIAVWIAQRTTAAQKAA